MKRQPELSGSERQQVDFDIHGVVGVRLLNATPADVRAVARQLGPLYGHLQREPDIVLRFVEHLPIPPLKYVELRGSGFTSDSFFILQSGRSPAKVQIDFEQIGRRGCEIVCESGLPGVPLLISLVNLIALKYDIVAVHGSAFVYDSTGVVVTGWAKGGKTEALLAFCSNGAEYVGDEWVWISADGRQVYGIPEHIRLWAWHLDNVAYLWDRVARSDRSIFAAIRALRGLHDGIPSFLRRTLPYKMLTRVMPALERQLNVRFSPEVVFGSRNREHRVPLDKLFLMLSGSEQGVTVHDADSRDIARRMLESLIYEQAPLMGHYRAFRFAFPEKTNELFEHAHEMQSALLKRALASKEAYEVVHPYPVELKLLFQVMLPYVAVRTPELREATAKLA